MPKYINVYVLTYC